jgi:arginase
MEEVSSRGLDAVLADALAIARSGTSAFGISVDLDAVSPEEAPGVGTPVPGGMSGADLTSALERIGGRADLAAVELVEYSPRLDPTGRSARVAIEILRAALCGAREQSQVAA